MERALFLRTWLADPRLVGAVAPSGASLARLITKEIVASDGPVIELGPGTGVFTGHILGTGLPPEHLFLVEKSAAFEPHLRKSFPASKIHIGDAADIGRTVKAWRSMNAQAVVSGLPLLTMCLEDQMRILASCFEALRPGASIYQFTYYWRSPVCRDVLRPLGLSAQRMGRVWDNLPPASVFRISKRVEHSSYRLGYHYNSMALLADGWHMSSHALALGLSVAAYVFARRLSGSNRFAFGTWKIEVLAGYTSAILLLLVALAMAYQSVERLLFPAEIQYEQAIFVAVIGLVVNLVCAWLLKDRHQHRHHHHSVADDQSHHHEHSTGKDLNLRSAYLHVLADAATSLLAIVALIGGLFWGFGWLDPAMGIVGSVLVAVWAVGLLRDSSRVLLDAEMRSPVVEEVREEITRGPMEASITDLHVWRVGKERFACIVALDAEDGVDASYVRRLLSVHEELVHVTVEVNRVGSPA